MIVPVISKLLGHPVFFSDDTVGNRVQKLIEDCDSNAVVLLENLRFLPGEENNDPSFAKSLAKLGDIFCNDAFSASHRAHASTVGVAQFLPNCMGLLMQEELTTLKTVLTNPEKPVVAVVGGAKVSSKLDLLINLIHKVDHLVIGGGMANTFLYAQGNTVGKSLCERNMKETALKILKDAVDAGCHIHIPNDAVIASDFKANAKSSVIDIGKVPDDALILDIGPSTCNRIDEIFHECRTLIWNGPMGAFEVPPFDKGTNITTASAAKLTQTNQLISVAGGGDTVSALKKAGVLNDFSYVSLAGGAFLEWMEGKELPGIACLN